MKPFTVAISSFFAFAFVVTVKAQTPAFTRTDFHVASTDGVQVFVREVTSGEPRKGTVAVVLVHGARAPGLASFDLEVANGSLAEASMAPSHFLPAMLALTALTAFHERCMNAPVHEHSSRPNPDR